MTMSVIKATKRERKMFDQISIRKSVVREQLKDLTSILRKELEKISVDEKKLWMRLGRNHGLELSKLRYKFNPLTGEIEEIGSYEG